MSNVVYVGHSTVLIDLDGVRLLTDPLLRERVTFLRRASTVDVDQLRNLDAVLISHAHYDHLDIPSLELLGSSVPVVVPRGLGRLLAGHKSVTEIVEDEEISFGAVTVRATHAEHEGRRRPGRITAAPSVSRSAAHGGSTSQGTRTSSRPWRGWSPTSTWR